MIKLTLAFFYCIAVIGISAAWADVTLKSNVPFREDAGLTKAEYFIAQENYTAALQESSAVIKRHPKSADAYVYRALSYKALGEDKKAQADLQKALAYQPTHLGANKYQADLYLENGETARALEQLQVLRMVCGTANCAELNALERDINAARKKKKNAE